MVSAVGLLFVGVQQKNLHLADSMRTLAAECRSLDAEGTQQERREQIVAQLELFNRRIWLSQRALEFLYVAVVCFVLSSIFLASESVLFLASQPFRFLSVTPFVTATMFMLGVSCLLLALIFAFTEIRISLHTLRIEIKGLVLYQIQWRCFLPRWKPGRGSSKRWW
jgi:hypothetical protein